MAGGREAGDTASDNLVAEAHQVFGLNGIWAVAAVILAALPTGVPVFIVEQRYGIYVERLAAAVAISTATSVFTLSALLIMLDVKLVLENGGFRAPAETPDRALEYARQPVAENSA